MSVYLGNVDNSLKDSRAQFSWRTHFMSLALLIIDVQHALSHGQYAVFEADCAIANINQVSAKVRAAGAPVIVIQHEAQDGALQYASSGWQLAHNLTTRRALGLGYPVTLIADAHSTLDNRVLTAAQITAHHNETLANISSFGVRVTLCNAADFNE